MPLRWVFLALAVGLVVLLVWITKRML